MSSSSAAGGSPSSRRSLGVFALLVRRALVDDGRLAEWDSYHGPPTKFKLDLV